MPRPPRRPTTRKARATPARNHRPDPGAIDQASPPATPDALHSWLSTVLGVSISRRAMIQGHAAPFDYLVHSFFEGGFEPAGGPRGARSPADCVVWASRGGGKTYLGAVATLLDLLFKGQIEVRILGGSLEQSQRMAEHLRRLSDHPSVAPLVAKRTERSLVMSSGARAAVLTHSQASVRGTRVQKVRCDEVELFDPEVWQAVQLTTRSLNLPGPWGPVVRGAVEALSTMHRPMGLMWDLAQAGGPREAEAPDESSPAPATPPARAVFRWGVMDVLDRCGDEHACDGCSLWTPCAGRAKRPEHAPGHVRVSDALAQRARVSRAVWETEMLCLRPSRGGSVLPEFDMRKHVYGRRGDDSTPLPEGRWVAGMDFGFRAPTVILWAHAGDDGVLRVEFEHVVSERTLAEHLAEFSNPDRPRPAFVAVDPAGAQRNDQTGVSNIAMLTEAGLRPRYRRSAILEGVMAIRRRLEGAPATPQTPAPTPRLLVHARCRQVITAMQRYHYPEDQPECDTPVKDGHDHAIDALRYLVLALDAPRPARGYSMLEGSPSTRQPRP